MNTDIFIDIVKNFEEPIELNNEELINYIDTLNSYILDDNNKKQRISELFGIHMISTEQPNEYKFKSHLQSGEKYPLSLAFSRLNAEFLGINLCGLTQRYYRYEKDIFIVFNILKLQKIFDINNIPIEIVYEKDYLKMIFK